MREIFVSELVKDILGPRKGINETMRKKPFGEYMTGVLQPVGITSYEPESGEGAVAKGRTGRDGDSDQYEDVYTNFSPTLDPKSQPSSIGLSFTVKASERINLRICATWGKYYFMDDGDGNAIHQRNPRFATCNVSIGTSESGFEKFFDEEGKNTDVEKGSEIILKGVVRREDSGNYVVSVYLVNNIEVKESDDGEKRASVPDYIFQPQIRIVCTDGTSLEKMRITNIRNDEEDEMDFLYRDKPFLARGHMTSAIWKDIDPQQDYDLASELDYSDAASDIPFAWIDGKQLGDEERKFFETPDVRTEHVPLHSIPSPEWKWDETYGPKPSLSPGELADTWEPQKLETMLRPLYDGYRKWIDRIAADKSFAGNKTVDRLVRDCKIVLKRIGDGIDLLCDPQHTDVALAFCFANKVIETQYRWANKDKGPMQYRPFQLGFILMSLESIANPKSEYRDVCDLIWVPTGGGKTEAYLVLIAFVIAYRRRLALAESPSRSGVGTAVLTRYTLRLLTIQQFRRTVKAVTAAEYLRVFRNTDDDTVGWRPSSFPDRGDFVWGSSQFSTGLWIGGGATPNRMEGWDVAKGALDLLRGDARSEESEPAQILECPSCSDTLSISTKGLPPGDHRIRLVVESKDGKDISQHVSGLSSLGKDETGGMVISNPETFRHYNERFFTVSLTIRFENVSSPKAKPVSAKDVDDLWQTISDHFEKNSAGVSLVPFRASRPGYFRRFYIKPDGGERVFDFEIFCPNPECNLHMPWFGGTPMGCIHNKKVADHKQSDTLGKKRISDGNKLTDIHDAFQTEDEYVSDRIPVPALTVDEQIYARVPSVIISTVDKFARPAFEPATTSIFGDTNRYHGIVGFYSNESDRPPTELIGSKSFYVKTDPLETPELILQDEMHLIEGPLGSMVGFYETAVEYLCNQSKKVKVLAATATIKKASEHVLSVFARRVQVFPPKGSAVDDRFFVTESEAHALDDRMAGRLYMGIIAPGKGAVTPLVRILARLFQTAQDKVDEQSKLPQSSRIPDFDDRIDPFWTLTSYFNAVRELAGGLAFYNQDIKDRIRQLSNAPRNLKKPIELSGRSKSTELPGLMDDLSSSYKNDADLSPDALFTTSMFGTGVDIQRLGLMVINGQTKTTSSYIQSSGRVGRSKAGLVVTLLRASRPRDLSHYEFFIKFHRHLHRFVEVPSVYPFASGVVDRAIGPVCTFMLRHMRDTPHFRAKIRPSLMESHRSRPEVEKIADIMKQREASQPYTRKLPPGANINNRIETKTLSALDRWQAYARDNDNLIYNEYARDLEKMKPVVLGDDKHQAETAGVPVVFRNAPQSLRELESETMFET